jgi:hypothetical protein
MCSALGSLSLLLPLPAVGAGAGARAQLLLLVMLIGVSCISRLAAAACTVRWFNQTDMTVNENVGELVAGIVSNPQCGRSVIVQVKRKDSASRVNPPAKPCFDFTLDVSSAPPPPPWGLPLNGCPCRTITLWS